MMQVTSLTHKILAELTFKCIKGQRDGQEQQNLGNREADGVVVIDNRFKELNLKPQVGTASQCTLQNPPEAVTGSTGCL